MPLVTRTSVLGNIYKQNTQPVSWVNGDLWIDTSVSPPREYVNDNGTAVPYARLSEAFL